MHGAVDGDALLVEPRGLHAPSVPKDLVGELTKETIGRGKVEELKLRINELGATLVIFDDELTPAQGKNVEAIVGTRVMDRAEQLLKAAALYKDRAGRPHEAAAALLAARRPGIVELLSVYLLIYSLY